MDAFGIDNQGSVVVDTDIVNATGLVETVEVEPGVFVGETKSIELTRFVYTNSTGSELIGIPTVGAAVLNGFVEEASPFLQDK